jgi:amino acid transporter
MDSLGIHRPRNVDWKRAAALLYGDLGTSKAYVIGLAFLSAGYASLPIILAVCILTALVCFNYWIICKHYPDGGGVYSAAREQSRTLAVMGALLLVAGLTVTSSMSAWTAMTYFGLPKSWVVLGSVCFMIMLGVMNSYGPKHSGSLAVTLAVPMVVAVVMIILLSLPHLSLAHLKPTDMSFGQNWICFAGVILALSGVETVANFAGVLKLDPNSSMDHPKVTRTAAKTLLPVGIEVVCGTALLGWAMLSLPGGPEIPKARCEDMLRFLAEQYGGLAAGPLVGGIFGKVVGLVVGMLLLGAVNTAIVAMIGLLYILARDGEMPKYFTKLNPHGVPKIPLILSVALPIAVVVFFNDMESLANLYAIGVVGAIAVNLGSCTFNRNLKLHWAERGMMAIGFIVLFAVELTIAKTKPDALFFAICILGGGMGLRGYSHKRAGLQTLTVTKEIADAVSSTTASSFQIPDNTGGQSILVAARGLTPVLRFAFEEARLRRATLYVLYVRELAVSLPAPLPLREQPKWQNNSKAAEIMYSMLDLGRKHQVTVVPLYIVSDTPAGTILDLAATLGIDYLMLGSTHRHRLVSILKGDVVTQVARNLPENIQLILHG